MALKKGSTMSDYEMLRAFTTEMHECEQSHNVGWRVTIAPHHRFYTLVIRLEAYEVGIPGAHEPPLCAYETSWPNTQSYGFTACLFNASVKLTRLVEDSRRDHFKATTPR